MIKLPINEKELDIIIETIKFSNPKLYNKLWSYKINILKVKKNGFSKGYN
jgi:hypothetical protein